jgi:ribose transport system substrate-binding protein
MAFVNGFSGNAWRIQAIQATKAWALRPENKKWVKDLRVVSVGADVAAQIAAIDNFIAAGFDIITFIAVNPTGFGPVIKRAKRAGSVLVPFDNILDTREVVQVNEPQKELGRLQIEAVLKHMKKKEGKLLEIRGVPGNSVDRDRAIGAAEVLKKYPKIKVVTVVGMWDTGTSQKVTADALRAHGRFDGAWNQWGSAGTINAFIDAGHPIIPMGLDTENGTMIAMAKHKIPGRAVGQAPSLSAGALAAGVALLQGHPLPALVWLPVPYTDSEDLEAGVNYFPDLPPTFVTSTGFKQCNIDFTPEELLGQTGDNL